MARLIQLVATIVGAMFASTAVVVASPIPEPAPGTNVNLAVDFFGENLQARQWCSRCYDHIPIPGDP
ncbi:hypothetical protein D9757_014027 [Collybiopsis confluens]|uniref:Uncharacterized protein n=1 Tax=Collybiopsis confluens TaxID=2823264 RepID=A0A8H5FPG2_9AGAR|nr:hypothetical protein D9757_014027 [Collybiopsis confluens]